MAEYDGLLHNDKGLQLADSERLEGRLITTSSYPQRKHPRLAGYDYGRAGAYFVTICTKDQEPMLGRIRDGECEPTQIGRTVEEEWLRTPVLRPNVTLDAHVVMPNHVHGILFIHDPAGYPERNMSRSADGRARHAHWGPPPSQTLGAIMRGFKSATTSRCVKLGLADGTIWHTQFHDHVIRAEADLTRIRKYIVTNVLRWELDCYFMDR